VPDPGVQDLDQAIGHHDLDRFTGERRSDDVVEPREGDPSVTVDPPAHPRRSGLLGIRSNRFGGERG